jgi:hypothetical protein
MEFGQKMGNSIHESKALQALASAMERFIENDGKAGASDGARTRDLRRDRPAL